MLRKLLRSALVVLLVGTVPMQALAALRIDVCNGVEHSGGHAQHAGAGHGDAFHGEPMNDGPADGSSHHHAGCGAATAIVARANILAADPPNDGIQAAPILAPEGFVPERLDRPPLTVSI